MAALIQNGLDEVRGDAFPAATQRVPSVKVKIV